MIGDDVGSIATVDGATGEDTRLKWVLEMVRSGRKGGREGRYFVSRDNSLESGYQSSSLHDSINCSLRMGAMATNAFDINGEFVGEGHHWAVLAANLPQRVDYREGGMGVQRRKAGGRDSQLQR